MIYKLPSVTEIGFAVAQSANIEGNKYYLNIHKIMEFWLRTKYNTNSAYIWIESGENGLTIRAYSQNSSLISIFRLV